MMTTNLSFAQTRTLNTHTPLLRLWVRRQAPRLMLIVLLLAFALRLYRLADSNVWWDEGWSVWLGRLPLGQIAYLTALDEHPPLHYWLLAGWNRLAGETAFAVRFSTVALAVALVALIYRLGKRIAGPTVGLTAAFLVTISRFHVQWSQEIKMYTLATLLTLASLYCLIRVLDAQHPRWWIGYILTTALAIYSHYLSLTIIAGQNLFVILWALISRHTREAESPLHSLPLLPWISAQIAVGMIFFPWFLYTLRPEHLTWQSAPRFDLGLFLRVWSTVLALGIPTHIERYTIPTIAILALSACGLLPLLKREQPTNRRNSLLLWCALLTPPLLTYLLSLPEATSLYAAKVEARYFLVSLPIFLLLLSWGLRELGRRSPLLALTGFTFVTATSAVSLAGYYGQRHLGDDFQSLAATLNAHVQPGDVVLLHTDAEWPTFAYYYHQPVPWKGVPNGRKIIPSEARRIVDPLLVGHRAIWLVITPDATAIDPRFLVERRLRRNLHQVADLNYSPRRLVLYTNEERDLLTVPPDNLRIQHPLVKEITPGTSLLGYDLALNKYRTGETIHLALYWQGRDQVRPQVALVNARGQAVRTDQATELDLAPGSVIRTRHALPITSAIPSGRYTLQIGLDGTHLSLRSIRVINTVRTTAANIQHQRIADLSDAIRFLGYDLEADAYSPGQTMRLTLYWQARKEMSTSYVVFVHLLGPYNPATANPIWGQEDVMPQQGKRPTTGWSPGEVVADEHRLSIFANAPPGDYEIEIGMYDPATGQRLPVYDEKGHPAGDRIVLQTVRITPR